MFEPTKPKTPNCNIIYLRKLGRDSYSLEELFNEVNSFANEFNLDPKTIQIGWDEDWTGYEDCEVSLTLSGFEKDENKLIRLEKHKENLEKYKKDMEAYHKFRREEKEHKAKLRRDEELLNKKKKLLELQKEINEYERFK